MNNFRQAAQLLGKANVNWQWWAALSFTILAFLVPWITSLAGDAAQTEMGRYSLIGNILDPQGQPVDAVEIYLEIPGEPDPRSVTESQPDGSWRLTMAEVPPPTAQLVIERAHFSPYTIALKPEMLSTLEQAEIYRFDPVELEREINAAFWIATVTFVGILLLIALELLHSTTAALLGLSVLYLVSYVGGAYNPNLFIFSFERGLEYINWEVIFLIIGMMVIIAIIEGTGIFQWLAFQAYRLSRGRAWLLVIILMMITAVASALLDNFTTMLLMTPISLQIGIALGINPLAFIIPEVLASNVGGISTLVGTPTNILIGAYAGIGFSDFLVNQTIGVLLALVVMAAYVLYHYRVEFRKQAGGISPKLFARLEQNAQINDPESLWKSGLVFTLVLIGFVLGERVHLVPAVPALVGATILLIWLKPDVHKMIKAVDWTTMVFFMALFIVVGAIQEVGLISLVAVQMSALVGENLPLGIFMIVFGVGTISVAIANIPLAASMLPIVEFLSGSIPGAGNKVLYYALSMGAAMGGNGLLIGGEANLVTAGITEQTDYPMSFKEFLKVGLPVTYLTLAVGFIWLLIRF